MPARRLGVRLGLEHDDVAPVDVVEVVAQLVDEDAVADLERRHHRLRRDVERLEQERLDDERDHERGDDQDAPLDDGAVRVALRPRAARVARPVRCRRADPSPAAADAVAWRCWRARGGSVAVRVSTTSSVTDRCSTAPILAVPMHPSRTRLRAQVLSVAAQEARGGVGAERGSSGGPHGASGPSARSSRSSHAGSLTAARPATSRPRPARRLVRVALDHPVAPRREPERDAGSSGCGRYTSSRRLVVAARCRRSDSKCSPVRRTARTRSTRNSRSSSARWHHAARYHAPSAWNTRHGSTTRVVISSRANEK